MGRTAPAKPCKKKRESPHVQFAFTWFDWTPEERARIIKYVEENNAVYAIFGEERCPTTGRPHLQGFLHLRQKKRNDTLADELGVYADKRVTIRNMYAKSSDKHNEIYCGKGDNVYTYGTPSVSGRAHKLDDACALARSEGLAAVARDMPAVYVRHHRGLGALVSIGQQPRRTKPTVIWLWGASGAGKTHMAQEIADEGHKTMYRKSMNTGKWFNGYEQQQVLLIDDIRCVAEGFGKTFMSLLDWLDRYETQVETKGGMVHLNSPIIFLTSIQHPEVEFAGENEHLAQLTRRIDHILEVSVANRTKIFDQLFLAIFGTPEDQ